jgi:hypothetical protein
VVRNEGGSEHAEQATLSTAGVEQRDPVVTGMPSAFATAPPFLLDNVQQFLRRPVVLAVPVVWFGGSPAG